MLSGCDEFIRAAISRLAPEEVSSWTEVHETLPPDYQQGLQNISAWTPEQRRAVEVALVDFVRSFPADRDPWHLVRNVAGWDLHLGGWIACACARIGLKHAGEHRSDFERVLLLSERCIRGDSSVTDNLHSIKLRISRIMGSEEPLGIAAGSLYSAADACDTAYLSYNDKLLMPDNVLSAAQAAREAAWLCESNAAVVQAIAESIADGLDAVAEGYSKQTTAQNGSNT